MPNRVALRCLLHATPLFVMLQLSCSLVDYEEHADGSSLLPSADAGGLPPSDAAPPLAEASTPGADAATPGDQDAALDATTSASVVDATTSASREPGWWEGRTPDQSCAGGDCEPVCDPRWQTCVFDCVDASNCSARCTAETACRLDCSGASNCDLRCDEAAQCWIDCPGASNCVNNCREGSYCVVDCTSASNCSLECREGASCEIDCSGDVDCSEINCADGAECLLHCPDEGCGLSCDGAAMTCPGSHEVCNRDCP